MFNALFQIIMAVSLTLGPKDMSSFAVQFDQPDSSHQSFTATRDSGGYWKLVDPLWKDSNWYKVEGNALLVRNEKGQVATWPIKDKMDLSELKKQSKAYAVRLEDWNLPMNVSRVNGGLRLVQNASAEEGKEQRLVPPLTVMFNTATAMK